MFVAVFPHDSGHPATSREVVANTRDELLLRAQDMLYGGRYLSRIFHIDTDGKSTDIWRDDNWLPTADTFFPPAA